MHHTDLKKWNGQAVKNYYVYETINLFCWIERKKIFEKQLI